MKRYGPPATGGALAVAPLCLCLLAGCAGTTSGRAQTADGARSQGVSGGASLPQRDPSGDLVLGERRSRVRLDSPDWLTGIRSEDVLVYRVRGPEAPVTTVRFEAARVERRGHGVAVLLRPVSSAPGLELHSYWLVGDADGLYQLRRHASLADPGFTPLDDEGRAISEVRNADTWRLPRGWEDLNESQGALPSDGWSIEELQMVLDGPVRGDRCALIVKRTSRPALRITVCSNVGIVELQQGELGQTGEHWELVQITRSPIRS